jgi:uncharacterized protein YdaU (DUF1376 family)
MKNGVNAWYPRYPGDYLRDTGHLSLTQHGAYSLLLDHTYSTESALPKKRDELYRICKAFKPMEQRAVDSVIRQFFVLIDGKYHNRRADREIERRALYRSTLSESGRRGASERWKNIKQTQSGDGEANGETNGEAIDEPNGLSMASHNHTHNQQQKTHTTRKTRGTVISDDEGFREFWQTYPKKEAKQAAIRAWKKIAQPDRAAVIAAVARRCNSDEWRREGGRYIPLPATFLNGRRWEDELSPVQPKAGPSTCVSSTEKNELSPEGAQRLKQYGVAS